MIWKWAFGILGLFSFSFILYSHGLHQASSEIFGIGWFAVPLLLSFIPVVACYAAAWKLVTPGKYGRPPPHAFFTITVVGIAWNNLSPFVKFLGEPIRVVLLSRWMDKKRAIQSILLYNLVHIYGTFYAFILGASGLLLLYPVPKLIRLGFFLLIGTVITLLFILHLSPSLFTARSKKRKKKNFLQKVGFWIRWSLSKIRIFSRTHPRRFWAAILFEISARFIEGLTFYVSFWSLGNKIKLIDAAFLDIGRALMDNVFFFIPYQMGSREMGIILLTDNVMKLGSHSALDAAIHYRITEIFWMGIGYIFWISWGRSSRTEI